MINSPEDQNQQRPRRSSWWRAFLSAIAAAFGVQSDKNRQQDFSESSPVPYIVAGIVFTVVFVGVLIGIVNLVL